QVGVVVGLDREEAAEHHRLDLAVARQRLGRLRRRTARRARARAGGQRSPPSPPFTPPAGSICGEKKPMSSISASVCAAIARISSPFLKLPSTTRTYAITPRYWSNSESKIRARGGASGSPEGGGTRPISSSSTSLTPSPVLPLMRRIDSGGSPISSA